VRLRVAAWAALALAAPLATASPAAADGVLCEGIEPDTRPVAVSDNTHLPFELLGVARATELLEARGTSPGEGVRVAVVDNGVAAPGPLVSLPLADLRYGPDRPVVDGHGTIIAGLVAGGERAAGGPTGIAPAAEIVDVRVYDEGLEGGGGIGQGEVVAALEWLAQNAEREGIGVVVTAFDVPPSAELRRAVAALSERDVVIVAGSGNRPADENQAGFEQLGTLRPGEDAVDEIFPAGYVDDVFAVSATADGVPVEGGAVADASRTVLLSSAIDAAVPVWGAVTLAPNGSTCVLDQVATSWAAGIAGGVVALVRSAYPEENAAQIEARLRATASGSLSTPTTATGAGVLQPVEALTQDLAPTRTGAIDDMPRERVVQPRITAPRPDPDPVAGTLADARWWGLVGGTAVVVALLVRPLLARRREG